MFWDFYLINSSQESRCEPRHMQISRCDFSTIVQPQLIYILFLGDSWSRPLPFSAED